MSFGQDALLEFEKRCGRVQQAEYFVDGGYDVSW